MTDFTALQNEYKTDPAGVFELIDAIPADRRLDLLVDNLGQVIRGKSVGGDKYENLPAAWRTKNTTRWDHFDYLLHYFDAPLLKNHMSAHLDSENNGGTYIRNALALLTWKSEKEEEADE